jgi:hypothetical protein
MVSTSSCLHFPASQPVINGYHEIHDLLAKEDDYAIDHATEAAIRELVSSGNILLIEELWDLFNNMDEKRE